MVPLAMVLLAALLLVFRSGFAVEPVRVTPEMRIVVDHVTASSLRGNLSFLASDLLEGRDTPSRGLDIAAEYIGAQFRKIGLEPVGDDGYFQTAPWNPRDPNSEKARNVVGILRGSDPMLKDTYVMVTAHYDHVGVVKEPKEGEDRIFNGANDDASGTVSMMEVANALAALHPRPKRSVLFVAFYGEEKGLFGSRYYAQHPVVPLQKTIADLNLEQMGRPDSTNGTQKNVGWLTGFDFSSMGEILAEAGRRVGVKIAKDEKASDPYFNRSDNAAIAQYGIPAHTLCVSFDFPDEHLVSDEWQKIDYDNMAKVDQAVALAVLHMASAFPPPKWNPEAPGARVYFEAGKRIKGE